MARGPRTAVAPWRGERIGDNGTYVKKQSAVVAICLVSAAVGAWPATGALADEIARFSAPFDGRGVTQASSVRIPCTPERVPVAVSGSEPEDGKLVLAAAARADDCASHGTSVSERWGMGVVPAGLVGLPGTVTLRLDWKRVDWTGGGTGDAAAHGRLAVAVGGVEAELVAFECVADGCRAAASDGGEATEAQGPREAVVRVDALPAEVEASFRADAWVTGGTAEARIEVRAGVESVTVEAAAS